jgi:hypothetical protein
MTEQTLITAFDFTNFVVGIISFALGILAFCLSIYFFNKAKEAEKATTNALEAIKAQTETLKDITAKQMTRLIKNVTEQKQPIEEFLTIITAVRDIPQNNVQLQLKDREIETLTSQAIEGYIGAYYYCACTNVWAQFYLPEISEFNNDDPFHTLVRGIVDLSARDFHNLKGILSKVPGLIQSSSVSTYYDAAEREWAGLVKDSITHMSEKAKQGS